MKKPTLRQMLLADASTKLAKIESEVEALMSDVADREGLDPTMLAKLVANNRNASIKQALVRDIANQAERELIERYSKQIDIFDEPEPDEPEPDGLETGNVSTMRGGSK